MQHPTLREMLAASIAPGVEGASTRLRAQLVASSQRRRLEASLYQPGASDISIKVEKDKKKKAPVDDTAPTQNAPITEAAATPISIPEGQEQGGALRDRAAFLEKLRPGLVKFDIKQTNTDGEKTISVMLDGSKLLPEESTLYEDMNRVISPDQVKETRRGEPLIQIIEQLHRTMTPNCYVWTPLLLLLNSGSDYYVSDDGKEPKQSNTTGRNALIQAPQLIDYFTYAVTNISHLRTKICNGIENEEGRKQEEDHLEKLRDEFNETEQIRQNKYDMLQRWAIEALFGKGCQTIPGRIPSFTDFWGDPAMDPEKMIVGDISSNNCSGTAIAPAADAERIRILGLVAQRRRVLCAIATSIYRLTMQRCHNLCRSLCQFMGVTPQESRVWGFLVNRVPAPDGEWTWPRGGFASDFGYHGLLRNLKEIDVIHADHDRAAVEASIKAEKALIVGTSEDAPKESLSGGSLTIAWCYWAFILSVLAQKSNVKDGK